MTTQTVTAQENGGNDAFKSSRNRDECLRGAELGGLAGIFLAIPAVAVITLASWHYRDHRAAELQDLPG